MITVNFDVLPIEPEDFGASETSKCGNAYRWDQAFITRMQNLSNFLWRIDSYRNGLFFLFFDLFRCVFCICRQISVFLSI